MRWARRLSSVIGFDDAPFDRTSKGSVALVGTVCSGPRLDIVVRGNVQRDGDDSTDVIADRVHHKALVHVRAAMHQWKSYRRNSPWVTFDLEQALDEAKRALAALLRGVSPSSP